MVKQLVLISFLSIGSLVVSAQQKKANDQKVTNQLKETAMFESKMDSASYAFGLSMARDLKKRGLKNLNGRLVAQAIEDFFSDKPLQIAEEQEYKAISDVLTVAAEELKKEQSATGDKFLAENKNKTGIHTTSSGLQYEVIRDAEGPKPQSTDSVTVNYKGALLDGKVFDSSYDRGEPISFQLNRVIQGWQEGLQLMPVGSHYRFYIPYQLGYGERGAGNDIPPFSVLVFDVELLKIGG